MGIQRLIGKKITQFKDHPYHFSKAIPKPDQKPGRIKESKKKTQRKKTQSQQDSSKHHKKRNRNRRSRRN